MDSPSGTGPMPEAPTVAHHRRPATTPTSLAAIRRESARLARDWVRSAASPAERKAAMRVLLVIARRSRRENLASVPARCSVRATRAGRITTQRRTAAHAKSSSSASGDDGGGEPPSSPPGLRHRAVEATHAARKVVV